ncbi:MAG: DMT family transporter [Bacteroidales bacterium]|nr:DMT family transporter [Bacteroidales bacterium]
MKNPVSSKYFGWIALTVLVFIWGTSFILIKRGLEVYSSVEVGALRIFISFLVLSPIAIQRIRKVPWKILKHIIIIGIIGTGIPAFLFAEAQTKLDSALAGILNSLTPLFTLIVGLVFFHQKTRWFNVVGVLLGLGGAVGLIYATSDGSFDFHFAYAIYVVIATVLYAFQSNMVKFYLNDVDPVTIASLGFFAIGIPATIGLFFFTDFPTKIISDENGLKAFFYIALLAVMASAFAIILYNKLVQVTSAVFASSVTYFVPFLAVIWGLNDGERFPLIAFLFMAIILFGVLMVNKRKK